MNDPRLDDVLSSVEEIAGPEAYYFYAQPGTRYSMTAGAILGVAAFLVGAFCDGFAGYIKGRAKALGEDAARYLWDRTKDFLTQSRQEQRRLVESSVADARSLACKVPISQSTEALAYAQALTTVLLTERGYPQARATVVVSQLTLILKSRVLYNEKNDLDPG
jgi:hypothetical protein